MSFKIIKAGTRTANMLSWFAGTTKKVTDLLPGSITRTKFETIAVEMEEQDHQFERAVRKAIPISVYRAFSFDLQAAVKASGKVTFTADEAPSEDVTIATGTRVATVASSTVDEVVFETVSEATLEAGETSVDVKVSCVSSGTVGNVAAGTIIVLKTSVSGIDSVANTNAFSNGSAVETEAERQTRFQKYIKVLARGTGGALEYAALKTALYDDDENVTEQVTEALEATVSASVAPNAPGGFTNLFIYNGSGGASEDLVAEVQQAVDGYTESDGTKVAGYKAAGVTVSVFSALEVLVDVSITIELEAGYVLSDVSATIQSSIESYLSGLAIGDTMVFNELVHLVMAVDGVYNVTFTTPTADISESQVIAPVFSGSGLDDLSSGGSFSGEDVVGYFIIEIDAEGAPDTFRWARTNQSGQAYAWDAEGVSITGAEQAIADDVTITFAATTGHTAGDSWLIRADRGVVLAPGTITITEA